MTASLILNPEEISERAALPMETHVPLADWLATAAAASYPVPDIGAYSSVLIHVVSGGGFTVRASLVDDALANWSTSDLVVEDLHAEHANGGPDLVTSMVAGKIYRLRGPFEAVQLISAAAGRVVVRGSNR